MSKTDVLPKTSKRNLITVERTPAKITESTPVVNADLLQPQKKAARVKTASDRKRILLTGCNSLVGHQLFQQMRNDDIMIKTGGKAHEFLGTLHNEAEKVGSTLEPMALHQNLQRRAWHYGCPRRSPHPTARRGANGRKTAGLIAGGV